MGVQSADPYLSLDMLSVGVKLVSAVVTSLGLLF